MTIAQNPVILAHPARQSIRIADFEQGIIAGCTLRIAKMLAFFWSRMEVARSVVKLDYPTGRRDLQPVLAKPLVVPAQADQRGNRPAISIAAMNRAPYQVSRVH